MKYIVKTCRVCPDGRIAELVSIVPNRFVAYRVDHVTRKISPNDIGILPVSESPLLRERLFHCFVAYGGSGGGHSYGGDALRSWDKIFNKEEG